jgi:phosphopantothenoylcysteine decarboxylase/phosphopantothenate--cysteine ligase
VWENADSVSHVSLAERSDLIIVAPATADVIARIAHGRADDLLTTTVLASAAPKLIVPAMHPHMWLNPATQSNVEVLRNRGMVVVEPEIGRLTGKDSGIGRFPETATIIAAVQELTNTQPLLQGKRVIVSTGGTRESIDPVRFIGNHSSGRQGLAIAYEALKAGADVTVIAGETYPFDLPGATVIKVKTAEEMLKVIEQNFVDTDVLVMAAAVADFKVDQNSPVKLKKDELTHIALVRNPDILATMGAKKRSHQVIVGFAAETAHDIENLGLKKMQSKGADLLYVNDVSGGAVFGQELTSGMLIGMDFASRAFIEESKYVVAQEIVKEVAKRLEIHG